MKSKYLKRILGAAIMALTLVFAFGISSMTTAQAQTPWDDYQYRRQQEERRRQEELRRQQEQQYQVYQQDDRWRRGRDRWGRGGWDGYPNWGGGYELRQTALNAGYNEGVKQGRADRNRRRGYDDDYSYGYDFRRYSSYQNATKDYNSRFGDRELYRRYFQMAYENGYADGLRGY